jgi:hypothetical protein
LKKKVALLLLMLLAASVCHAGINGTFDESREIPVLTVWGTPYEMGYAHGYFLGSAVREEFDGYILPLTLYISTFYEFVVDLFQANYTVPQRYEIEAEGLIDGAIDAGVDLYIPELGREMNALDLAVTGAMPDIVGLVSCSSLVAWGEATENVPELEGELALVRNMDWLALPSDPTFLARETLLIARIPDDRRPTLSVTFPGLLGCLSCMNDAGVTAMHHQVHPGVLFFARDYSERFVPINISVREGLEMIDPDGDGASTVKDVATVVEALPKSSQYNIVLADAFPEASRPMSLETANAGSARRYDSDEPDFPAQTIGITNRFFKLKDQNDDDRYEKIRANANRWYGAITLERLWQNNRQVAMRFPIGSITAQTMIFIPSQRRFALNFSDQELLAPEKEPIWFEWDEIFPDSPTPSPSDDDDDNDDDADIPADSGSGDDEDDEACCG